MGGGRKGWKSRSSWQGGDVRLPVLSFPSACTADMEGLPL